MADTHRCPYCKLSYSRIGVCSVCGSELIGINPKPRVESAPASKSPAPRRRSTRRSD